MQDTQVTDNPAASRFEVRAGGGLAGFVAYRLPSPGTIALVHTEIDPDFEGRGLAGRLVQEALGAAGERGWEVLPYCPFVRGWILRHPAYARLVPREERAGFGLPEEPPG